MKPSTLRLGLLSLLVACLTACHRPVPIRETLAYANRDETWSNFRAAYKYHAQIIGVKSEQDNSHAFIVSEPPESITEQILNNFLRDFNADLTIKTNPVGVDGWLKDAVITVNDLDSGSLAAFKNKLNKLIYGDSYKPYTLSLPLPASSPYLDENVNYNISAAELKKWLITDGEAFYPAGNPDGLTTLNDILGGSGTGIFYSKADGFVAWAMPANGLADTRTDDIRKFCLDGDLILGAIANSSVICIIARERKENVIALPPLRVETILQLAAANSRQLSQSYERTSMFAGKLRNGHDWAPIYLSDELLNTEYGSLLNVTDQMLKSWSENGRVSYANFDYLVPGHWAFRNGVAEDMNADQLTYNWNTKAASYEVADGGMSYIALNQMGALPVTYIPEGADATRRQQVEAYEQKAYAFFSGLNNKDLIRANQYAALYQIFKRFGITSGSAGSQQKPAEAAQVIKSRLSVLLTQISKSSDDYIVEHAARAVHRLLGKDSASTAAAYYSLEYSIKMDSVRRYVKLVSDEEDGIDHLAEAMTSPRDFIMSSSNDTAFAILGSWIMKHKEYAEAFNDGDIDDIMDSYQSAYGRSQGHWVKTPSIVVSLAGKDSLQQTGGHNIEARIMPVRINNELATGEFRVVEEAGGKVLYVAERDLDKVNSSFLKSVQYDMAAGNRVFSNSQRQLGAQAAVRERQSVIGSVARLERGLAPDHLQIRKSEGGLYVLQSGNVRKEIYDCKNLVDELTAYSRSNGQKDIRVTFTDFTEQEAKATVRSSDIKLAKEARLAATTEGKLTTASYNFGSLTTEVQGDNILLTIPGQRVASDGTRWSRTAKININAKPTIRTRVLNIIERIKRLFSGRAAPQADFLEHLRLELHGAGISNDEIRLEVDDCLMCIHLYRSPLNHDSPTAPYA